MRSDYGDHSRHEKSLSKLSLTEKRNSCNAYNSRVTRNARLMPKQQMSEQHIQKQGNKLSVPTFRILEKARLQSSKVNRRAYGRDKSKTHIRKSTLTNLSKDNDLLGETSSTYLVGLNRTNESINSNYPLHFDNSTRNINLKGSFNAYE